jgi:dipeptide/tripeptide permease
VDALLSFAAALLSLRLAGSLIRRGRVAWAAGLASFAVASAAMAWGSAHGWDAPSFRVYYAAGALLSAPLLGIGSLLIWNRGWSAPVGLVYTGIAIGIAAAMPVHGSFSGKEVPHAQDHLAALPRAVAIVGSSVGTLAVLVVAFATFRRRPVGNAFLVGALAAAGAASALTQTAVSATAALFALAAALLYAGAR